MKTALALLCLAATRAHAGFGGMGNVEDPGGAGGSLAPLFWCAAAGALLGWIYCKVYNGSHAKQLAADGCMILGGMAGFFLCPVILIAMK